MSRAELGAAPSRWTYGPVPSRRLGRSLGVDLVPFKTCTYDCVYCQLGRTTKKTVEREEYAPVASVLTELEERLGAVSPPDWIALAGSGEPTLYSGIGELIRGIKKITEIPVAVLTNGALLADREVQEGILDADLVLPSLDAGDERTFRHVNRPHASIRFDRMVDGLSTFTARFPRPVWLEVFLLGGVTGMPAEVAKIADLVRRIRPARVQLNTVSRPPGESFAYPVSRPRMREFAASFQGDVDVLVGGERTGASADSGKEISDGEILALLGRRPATLRGIAFALGFHPAEAAKRLSALVDGGSVVRRDASGENYYALAGRTEPS